MAILHTYANQILVKRKHTKVSPVLPVEWFYYFYSNGLYMVWTVMMKRYKFIAWVTECSKLFLSCDSSVKRKICCKAPIILILRNSLKILLSYHISVGVSLIFVYRRQSYLLNHLKKMNVFGRTKKWREFYFIQSEHAKKRRNMLHRSNHSCHSYNVLSVDSLTFIKYISIRLTFSEQDRI